MLSIVLCRLIYTLFSCLSFIYSLIRKRHFHEGDGVLNGRRWENENHIWKHSHLSIRVIGLLLIVKHQALRLGRGVRIFALRIHTHGLSARDMQSLWQCIRGLTRNVERISEALSSKGAGVIPTFTLVDKPHRSTWSGRGKVLFINVMFRCPFVFFG